MTKESITTEPAKEGMDLEQIKQQLVQLLREKGIGDAETKKLLLEWIIAREQEVENSANRSEEQIKFNIETARLYFAAGYKQEGFVSFARAREQAWNENKADLYQEITKEMNEIEKDSTDEQNSKL